MTNQPSPTTVVVAGMTFGLIDSVTLDGWSFSNLQGWYDGPGVRTSFTPRPNMHGSFDAPVFRDVRTHIHTGTFTGADFPTATAAASQLAGLLGDGSAGSFAVDNLSTTVRLAQEPQLSWYNNSCFSFQVAFTAVDPRKYATVQTDSTGMATTGGGLSFPIDPVFDFGTLGSPGTAEADNAGTADTPLTLRVDGPVPGGFRLTEINTSSVLQFEDDLATGNWITLYSDTGRVTINDTADRRGSLSIAQFSGFQIPPGGARIVKFEGITATSPTALLTLTSTPAYW